MKVRVWKYVGEATLRWEQHQYQRYIKNHTLWK